MAAVVGWTAGLQWAGGLKTVASAGLLAVMLTGATAQASGPDESIPDSITLTRMEQQADHASPRDQCYLYTQLLHALTELAGSEIVLGQDTAQVVQRINAVMAKLQSVVARDAKKLREAEELMDHTSRRLQDMSRVVSGDERAAMQVTLQRLNEVHTKILNLVFLQ